MTEQTGRSLRLTPEQQANANTALSKFGSKADLAAALPMSRTTINKFFKGESVQVKNFHAICKKLKFDWQPEPATPLQSNTANADIDELVREVRDRCFNRILTTCNRIQLYTLKQIELEKLFVPVFVSQEPSSQRENSRENPPSSPALEIVNRHQHLMILGKPGAGKSTFASYLATTCCRDRSQTGWIPVLLRLSDVVDTRTPFNLLELLGIAFDTEQPITQQILKSGKIFLILDGLDEVSSQLRQDICQEISNFINNSYANKVVITCRTDVKDYKLPSSFERVEIADFDKTQQNQFIKNWFSITDEDPINWVTVRLKQHPECTDRTLINYFQNNQRLQELAKTPILLSLICLVYVSDGTLPEKRSSLYERGLDILLEQWDENRGVENRVESIIYNSLSSDDKRKILGELARYTFDQVENTVVFEQATALEIIANYRNYSPQESLEILEGIAADHGLLFQSARKNWEFSHLTFQEYFVAQCFVQHQDWQVLAQNVCDPRWREVFLLTSELCGNQIDSFALKIHLKIQEKFIKDKIDSLLLWSSQVINTSGSMVRCASLRAAAISFFSDVPISLTREDIFHSSISEIAIDIACSLGFSVESARHLLLTSDFARETNFAKDFNRIIHMFCDLKQLEIFQNIDTVINSLEKLAPQFIYPDEDKETRLTFAEIFLETWLDILPYNFSLLSLSQSEVQELEDYFYSCSLLLKCLDSSCLTMSEVRKEIEETLLLPIAEIEKRKSNIPTHGEYENDDSRRPDQSS